ncbi:MAG: PQQ-binding-like beta-propeller repeat protein [Planctomycetes bacterium]|nr:PQQ-binding-like beta-propeller repeat protein [Planctomycetota bacterium]
MNHASANQRWMTRTLASPYAVVAVIFLAGGCAPSPPAAPEKKPGTAGADWPMWGGTPQRNMVNRLEKNIPHEWDLKSGKNIKWVADLGSQSYGNPVVANGKIFVGTNNQLERNPKIKGDKGVVMCFDEADGKFLWQAAHDKLPAGRVNDWPEQGICSTAAAEGNRIYYVSNRAELVCADMDGFLDGENDGPYTGEKYKDPIDADFIWVLDMMEELTVFPHNLATSSPVIAGDLAFLVTSNGVDESHVVIPSPNAPSFIAVDKNTGKVVWEDSSPGDKILHGQWTSPCFGRIGGKDQVLFGGGNGWLYAFELKAVKPQVKLELAWQFDCNPKDAKYELGGRGTRNEIIATPVIHEDRVYVAVGQDPEHGEGIGHLYCIDPAGKSGDITESGKAWHYGDKNFHRTISTVAVKDGLVYAADLSGFLNCLDAKTGKPYWKHDALAAVWGSPTVIDGKVFLGDEDGDVVVVKEGRELKVLAENNFGNPVYSTPVAAHGTLYITNRSHLYAIQQK